MHFLYRIVNKINGKTYFGITSNPYRRKQQHFRDAKKNKQDTYFYRAIRKYGAENFSFEILQSFSEELNAYEYEKYFIKKYNTLVPNGYNSTAGGKTAKMYCIPWNKGKVIKLSIHFNKRTRLCRPNKIYMLFDRDTYNVCTVCTSFKQLKDYCMSYGFMPNNLYKSDSELELHIHDKKRGVVKIY